METLIISYTVPNASASASDKVKALIENVLSTRLASYTNISYVGLASSGSYREGIFQIGTNTDYYLRIGKLTSNSNYTANALCNRMSSSGSTSVVNNYLRGQNLDSKIDWAGTNNEIINTTFYIISDAGDNLKVLWYPAPTYSYKADPYPIIFTKTRSNRDIVIIFCDVYTSPTVYYLDDPNYVAYYLYADTRSYDSPTDVAIIKNIPIVASTNSTIIIDTVDSEMVQIFNTSLGAKYVNGDNRVYDNRTGFTRTLIQVGNKYYRQLSHIYWIEDPKGDEAVEYLPASS